jgi:5-methylcytosine-specific restriction protein A
MPHHPARPCARRGCIRLVHGSGARYCDEHLAQARKEQDARRGTAAERGYGADWQKVREKFLAEHPFCDECGHPSEIAHHVIRRRDGGSDDPRNLRPKCSRCHSRLHAKTQESFGGRVTSG